jgi:alginate O-acetyltransferase complex protein AlgI
MTFTTITFLVFMILFFSLYWIVAPKNKNLRNLLIILGGYIFYGWWDWRFLLLLIFSSTIDFCSGLLIDGAKTRAAKKGFLWLSLGVNISLLGFFKYCDFFIKSFNDLMIQLGYEGDTKLLNIILPVGLSFYTFQSMSYALDVYKGKLKPTRNVIEFFAFVAFFPQLVSGPIERAVNMLPQFAAPKKFDYSQAVSGLRMIIWGLFKKMVIADTFAVVANTYFGAPGDFDSVSAWIGVFAFAMQIYCDFSGYSDIAIGTARLLGFELMMNFRTPYFSKTFTEFWQRWHISLSTWFRDYVFIPLGGSKKGFPRYMLNILITFLLSGFWHGANYTFIIWGFLHGSMLITEKRIMKWFPNYKGFAPLVFLIVMLYWIPFRSADLVQSKQATSQLFAMDTDYSHFIYPLTHHNSWFLPVFMLFVIAELWINKKSFSEKIILLPKGMRWIIYYGLIACILLFGDFKNAPSFIYFQF